MTTGSWRRILATAGGTAALLWFNGCATAPETGRKQLILLSASEETQMGLSEFTKLKERLLGDSPETSALETSKQAACEYRTVSDEAALLDWLRQRGYHLGRYCHDNQTLTLSPPFDDDVYAFTDAGLELVRQRLPGLTLSA